MPTARRERQWQSADLFSAACVTSTIWAALEVRSKDVRSGAAGLSLGIQRSYMLTMLPKGRVERSTLLGIDSEWRISIRRACCAPRAGCARPVAAARRWATRHQQRQEHRRRTAKKGDNSRRFLSNMGASSRQVSATRRLLSLAQPCVDLRSTIRIIVRPLALDAVTAVRRPASD